MPNGYSVYTDHILGTEYYIYIFINKTSIYIYRHVFTKIFRVLKDIIYELVKWHHIDNSTSIQVVTANMDSI